MKITTQTIRRIPARLKRLLLSGGDKSPQVSFRPGNETSSGWLKYIDNPVLGGKYGTCFDASVLKNSDRILLYFSWRPEKSIALVKSTDGIHWSEPVKVLTPQESSSWELDLNRPSVLYLNDTFHLWYTGQNETSSAIGYATSSDGISFTRFQDNPVMIPDNKWELDNVMCPDVSWDSKEGHFRMWYSAGEKYEPNAIGYATSPDGVIWQKYSSNPIFQPDKDETWEMHKVTACNVVQHDGYYYMFYIGFSDEHNAQIGIARSRNGMDGWERHPNNPVIRQGRASNSWDYHAVYKPTVLKTDQGWSLWYNGRCNDMEQIGLATHSGDSLWV